MQGSNNENSCKVAKEEITKGGCRNAKSVLSVQPQCANFVFQKCSIFAPCVQILSGCRDSQSVTIVQALSNTLKHQIHMPLLLFIYHTVQCCAKGQNTPWQFIHISHRISLTVHLQENSQFERSRRKLLHILSSQSVRIVQAGSNASKHPDGNSHTSHLILSLVTNTIKVPCAATHFILQQNCQSVRIVQAGMLCQILPKPSGDSN